MIKNFKDDYSWLSNFSPHGFYYAGLWYPSNEHFFQAMKTLEQPKRVIISKTNSPGIAKKNVLTFWIQRVQNNPKKRLE